jgi:hypothetical protein
LLTDFVCLYNYEFGLSLCKKKQYAALIYNRDKIKEIDDNELQLTINVQLFLEMLLLEIRGKTISFVSYIKKIKEQRFRDLQEEIANFL